MPLTDWHPQIHRRFAEMDGRVPSDFTWLDYPVSNVRMELRDWDTQPVVYLAEMSPETPQVNAYFKADERLRDREYREVQFGKETWYELLVMGSALSRVRFSLVDLADHAIIHEVATDHINGHLEAGIATGNATRGRSDVWQRLTPGNSIRVRLEALPLFFPYNNPETGSGGTEYSNVNNGYLGGELAVSREYTLTMTPDGLPEPPTLLLDGQAAPKPGEFQLRGPGDGEAFHVWLSRERRRITAADPWVTAEIIAGQVGMDVDRYAAMESGTATPEDWERANIEDAIKGWQQAYG